MIEVELVNQANILLDFYENEYKKYYRTKPILDQANCDRTFLKDLCRQHGLEKARLLVGQFFRSQNDWFKKKAHSLDVLKRNLNVVNAELGRRYESQLPSTEGTSIRVKAHCANGDCLNRFEVECNSNDIYKATWDNYCAQCALIFY